MLPLLGGIETVPLLTFGWLDPVDVKPQIQQSVTIGDIQKQLEGGFVPFKLRTFDGCEFQVPHREFIFITPRRIVIADKKSLVNVLDPLHIVSIEEAKALPSK